jgi:hypothetical protein
VETPAQKVARLLGALEDLTCQEALLLRAGDYPGVVQTQQRIAPLVECLVGLAAAAGNSIRARIAAVVDQRRHSEEWLAAALARGREEVRQIRANQRRIAQVRPVYVGAAAGGRQLSAQG